MCELDVRCIWMGRHRLGSCTFPSAGRRLLPDIPTDTPTEAT